MSNHSPPRTSMSPTFATGRKWEDRFLLWAGLSSYPDMYPKITVWIRSQRQHSTRQLFEMWVGGKAQAAGIQEEVTAACATSSSNEKARQCGGLPLWWWFGAD
jgi:hypothetical protein